MHCVSLQCKFSLLNEWFILTTTNIYTNYYIGAFILYEYSVIIKMEGCLHILTRNEQSHSL